MASLLRSYKLLGKINDFYRELKVTVCNPIIDKVLKEALQLRQKQQSFGPE